MTDDELVAEVRKWWEHWAGHLGLENWRDHYKIDPKLPKNTVLRLDVDGTGYHSICVRINPKTLVNSADRDQLPFYVLHEAMHLILDPLDTLAYGIGFQAAYRTLEEGICDILARTFLRLHEQTPCGKGSENGHYATIHLPLAQSEVILD